MQVFHESDVPNTPIFVKCQMHMAMLRRTADADDEQDVARSTQWTLAKIQSLKMLKVNRFPMPSSLEAYDAIPVLAHSHGPVMGKSK
jgi:hypothetical protein